MNALKWITREAKTLRRKYPKRFREWKDYVAQASAIYARKHGGESPVGKKAHHGRKQYRRVKGAAVSAMNGGSLRRAILDLWHISRTALATRSQSRHSRMVYVKKELKRTYPELVRGMTEKQIWFAIEDEIAQGMGAHKPKTQPVAHRKKTNTASHHMSVAKKILVDDIAAAEARKFTMRKKSDKRKQSKKISELKRKYRKLC